MSGDGLPPLRKVIEEAGLAPRKGLGQHFLHDLNLTRRIARAGGPLAGVDVLEIGPGPGGLTRALLAEGAAHVLAIERDERALGPLASIAAAYPGRLSVIAGDALATDMRAALAAHGRPPCVRIIANLPYNIATPLLVRWLTEEPWPPFYESAIVMVQKEVGMRLSAPSGTAAFGRLAVLAQARGRARLLFEVPPRAFVPPPKVVSAVLRLDPDPLRTLPFPMRALEAVTAAAFGQRRKMLRGSLRAIFEDPVSVLEGLGLDPEARAETLAVAAFLDLAAAHARHSSGPP